MNVSNYIKLEFPSKSVNEGYARSAVAAFAAQLDPTLEELGDIRRRGAQRHGLYHHGELHGQAPGPLRPGKGHHRDYGPAHPGTERRPMTEENLADIRASQSGDAAATERLVERNSGLIWSVARRFFGRGVDSDDLYQLGCVGFLKAIEGFDEAYGTQFSTYAVPKISGEIRRFLRDDGAIKVSRTIKEQALVIRTARNDLEQRLNRAPTLSEISEATGIAPEDIAVAETATGPTESLQRESGDGGFTLENVLGDYGEEERVIEQVSLKEAIKKLPEKEQQVISLRYYHGLTQDKASRVVGVSQVQVSRLEKRAIEKLRLLLEA